VILGDGVPRHTEIVRLLVTHSANVNLADANGVSPLGGTNASVGSAIL